MWQVNWPVIGQVRTRAAIAPKPEPKLRIEPFLHCQTQVIAKSLLKLATKYLQINELSVVRQVA
jgi:hypothetical protein